MTRKYVVLCACATLVIVGQVRSSHAFALARLAAAIDVSRVAAAGALPVTTNPANSNVPDRLVLPATIQLTGASTEVLVGAPTECTLSIEVADDAGAPMFLAELHMPAGWQKVGFSGRDSQGKPLPNGNYYYTVTAEGTSRTVHVVINR